MKKLLIVLGSLFGVFTLAAILIPLLVPVDRYRPALVRMVNSKINGQFSLGQLGLSLWGQIRVDIAGMSLEDAQGKKLLAVNQAYFRVPLSTILGGSPELNLVLKFPELSVMRDANAQLNLMSIIKGVRPTDAGGSAVPAEASGNSLPAMVSRSRLGVELQDARVHYLDQATGLKSELKDLAFQIHDLSLLHACTFDLQADLDTEMAQLFLVRGPFSLKGKATPTVKDGVIDSVQLSAHFVGDDLEISSGENFRKAKGVAAHGDVELTAGLKDVVVKRMMVQLLNAQVEISGSMQTAAAQASSNLDLQIGSNRIDLKPWGALLPALKQGELAGQMQVSLTVKGQSDDPQIQGEISVSHVTAKAPQLKVVPELEAQLKFTGSEINPIKINFQAPGNDLSVTGSLKSFAAPRLSLNVRSRSLVLDQLMDFSTPSPGATATPTTGSKSSTKDLDALVDPLRQNARLKKLSAQIEVQMQSLRYQGVNMQNMHCHLGFKDLTFSGKECSLEVFKGQVRSSFQTALQPRAPTYRFNLDVAHLDLQEAVSSKMELFKNTVIGRGTFTMKGEGQSFNKLPAMKNLKAQGSIKVEQARFTAIDVARMVKEGLDQSLEKVAQKVPALKNQKIPFTPPPGGSKYALISTHFKIADEKMIAPDLLAQSEPKAGIDLKGETEVGLIDQHLRSSWELIDTWNLTHARDLQLDVAGTRIEHILASGNDPVRFKISVGGTLAQPVYNYGDLPESLAKVVLGNIQQAATGRVKQEVQKQAEQVIEKSAPPQIRDLLKNKLKGIF